MTKPVDRYPFDELEQLAQEKERHQLELKNSCFVLLNHPGNPNRKVTDKHTLKTTLSLFIQVWFSNTYEIPEEQKEVAQMQGERRYVKFIEMLGKRL